jgi:DNA-binding cell septation regulator SpoVG
MKTAGSLKEFIEKVDNIKKANPLDLSSDQDLSIAIMNLISIEEHLVFSGAKTQDASFYDLINPIREHRKELLKKIVKTYKGEVWCISKHLLAGCMRLMEVGTKALSAGRKEEAYPFFETSYSLYCLFWGLNINSVSDAEAKDLIKKLDAKTLENIESDKETPPVDNTAEKVANISPFGKLKAVISKAIDCCRE